MTDLSSIETYNGMVDQIDARIVSDNAKADERTAIEAVRRNFSRFRSELQDAHACMTTQGNRDEVSDILSELEDLIPDWSEMLATLEAVK